MVTKKLLTSTVDSAREPTYTVSTFVFTSAFIEDKFKSPFALETLSMASLWQALKANRLVNNVKQIKNIFFILCRLFILFVNQFHIINRKNTSDMARITISFKRVIITLNSKSLRTIIIR